MSKKKVLSYVISTVLVVSALLFAASIAYIATIGKANRPTAKSTTPIQALYATNTDDIVGGAYGVVCRVPGEVVPKAISQNGSRYVQITCTDQRKPLVSNTQEVWDLQKAGTKFNVDTKMAAKMAKFKCEDGTKVFMRYYDDSPNGELSGYDSYDCTGGGNAVPIK